MPGTGWLLYSRIRKLKIDGHHVRIVNDQIIYIEENRDAIPISADPEKLVSKLRFHIGLLKNRKIYIKDRWGYTDELITSSTGAYHFRNAPAEIQLIIQKMLIGENYANKKE